MTITKEQAQAALEAFENEYAEIIKNPPLTCRDLIGNDQSDVIIKILQSFIKGYDDAPVVDVETIVEEMHEDGFEQGHGAYIIRKTINHLYSRGLLRDGCMPLPPGPKEVGE